MVGKINNNQLKFGTNKSWVLPATLAGALSVTTPNMVPAQESQKPLAQKVITAKPDDPTSLVKAMKKLVPQQYTVKDLLTTTRVKPLLPYTKQLRVALESEKKFPLAVLDEAGERFFQSVMWLEKGEKEVSPTVKTYVLERLKIEEAIFEQLKRHPQSLARQVLFQKQRARFLKDISESHWKINKGVMPILEKASTQFVKHYMRDQSISALSQDMEWVNKNTGYYSTPPLVFYYAKDKITSVLKRASSTQLSDEQKVVTLWQLQRLKSLLKERHELSFYGSKVLESQIKAFYDNCLNKQIIPLEKRLTAACKNLNTKGASAITVYAVMDQQVKEKGDCITAAHAKQWLPKLRDLRIALEGKRTYSPPMLEKVSKRFYRGWWAGVNKNVPKEVVDYELERLKVEEAVIKQLMRQNSKQAQEAFKKREKALERYVDYYQIWLPEHKTDPIVNETTRLCLKYYFNDKDLPSLVKDATRWSKKHAYGTMPIYQGRDKILRVVKNVPWKTMNQAQKMTTLNQFAQLEKVVDFFIGNANIVGGKYEKKLRADMAQWKKAHFTPAVIGHTKEFTKVNTNTASKEALYCKAMAYFPYEAGVDVDKAKKLTPVLQQLTLRLKKERGKVADPFLEKMVDTLLPALHYDNWGGQYMDKVNKEARPFLLARIDLEDELLHHLKGRKGKDAEQRFNKVKNHLSYFLVFHQFAPDYRDVLDRSGNAMSRHFIQANNLKKLISNVSTYTTFSGRHSAWLLYGARHNIADVVKNLKVDKLDGKQLDDVLTDIFYLEDDIEEMINTGWQPNLKNQKALQKGMREWKTKEFDPVVAKFARRYTDIDEQKATFQQLEKKLWAMRPKYHCVGKKAEALAKLTNSMAKAVKTQKNISLDELWMSAVKQDWQTDTLYALTKEQKAYMGASIDLQKAICERIKGDKSEKADNIRERISSNLMDYYANWHKTPEARELLEKAANCYVPYFIEPKSKTVEDLLERLNDYSNARPWLILGTFDLMTKRLQGLKASLPKCVDTPEKRKKALEALSYLDYTYDVAARDYQEVLGEKVTQKMKAWHNKEIGSLYAGFIKDILKKGNSTPEERLQMGRAIGIGMIREGTGKVQGQMQKWGVGESRFWVYPDVSKADRYGKGMGPFSKLFLDFDRIVHEGDMSVARGHLNWKDARVRRKIVTFNRDAISLYLGAAKTLAQDGNKYVLNTDEQNSNPILVGLIQHRFLTSIQGRDYWNALPPVPEFVGEHTGLFLNIPGGRKTQIKLKDFQRMKLDWLNRILHPGKKKDGKAYFERFDKVLDYGMLVFDRKIEDPKKQAAERKKEAFQTELKQRRQLGRHRFTKAMLSVLVDRFGDDKNLLQQRALRVLNLTPYVKEPQFKKPAKPTEKKQTRLMPKNNQSVDVASLPHHWLEKTIPVSIQHNPHTALTNLDRHLFMLVEEKTA